MRLLASGLRRLPARAVAFALCMGLSPRLQAVAFSPGAAPGATPAEASSPPDADLSTSFLQPGSGRGDFEFAMDATSLRPAGPGKTLVRVLVQLPARAILEQTRADAASLGIRLSAFDAGSALRALAGRDTLAAAADEDAAEDEAVARRDARGRAEGKAQSVLGSYEGVQVLAEASAVTELRAAARRDLRQTDYRLADVALELAPGDYVLETVVENRSRSKPGLLDRLRRRQLSSVARLMVRVPDLTREPALADLAFQSGHGTHADYASRLYGLLNDSLHVRTTLFAHGECVVRAVAADRGGEMHWRDSLRVNVAGSQELTFHASVNTLPAGQFVLRVSAQGLEGGVSTARGFDVIWSVASWQKPRRDLDLEAEIVLIDAQYQAFRGLPPGEKERYMEDFWRRHDPTPDTAHNELREEFNRRVAYADLNFTESQRGALSDRGKVYIRYGSPTELHAEAVPGHLAGRGAEEALDKVDDAYVATEHGGRKGQEDAKEWEILGSSAGSDPRDAALRRQEYRRVIPPASEVMSYELWIYSGSGSPLMPEDRAVALDSGLRLLFVDLEGYGRYRLRKSSASLAIPGLATGH